MCHKKYSESVGISCRRMQKSDSEMTCIISGSRRQSDVGRKRTGSSVCLQFQRKTKHLARLIAVFAKSNNFKPAFLKAARLYTVYVPCGNDS